MNINFMFFNNNIKNMFMNKIFIFLVILFLSFNSYAIDDFGFICYKKHNYGWTQFEFATTDDKEIMGVVYNNWSSSKNSNGEWLHGVKGSIIALRISNKNDDEYRMLDINPSSRRGEFIISRIGEYIGEIQTPTYTHWTSGCNKLSEEAVSEKLDLISIKKREGVDEIQKIIEERNSKNN